MLYMKEYVDSLLKEKELQDYPSYLSYCIFSEGVHEWW